jgi:hypothetical protein
MEKFFIFALAGTGKTYISENYSNAVEVPMNLKYLFDANDSSPLEQRKYASGNTPHPDYPRNFIDASLKALKEYDVVMVPLNYESFAVLIGDIEKSGARIVIVSPSIECVDEYMERWISRGNNQQFLEIRLKSF